MNHPAFSNTRFWIDDEIAAADVGDKTWMRASANEFIQRVARFTRFGKGYFPLAPRDWSLMCSLNILFLRPDIPGNIIQSGDIDNRIKTLFDALRIPISESEIIKARETEKDEPLFCLLEDDSLITHVSIETDTLLQPVGETWNDHDVRLALVQILSDR